MGQWSWGERAQDGCAQDGCAHYERTQDERAQGRKTRGERGPSRRKLTRMGAVAAVAALTVLAGCDTINDVARSVGGISASSGVQGAALKGPTVAPGAAAQNMNAQQRTESGLPNSGPPLGTIRKTKIYNETHNVALRGGVGMSRRYIVQRADLQPMWSTQKSMGKALTAIGSTFARDACAGGRVPVVTAAYREPIGIWVVDLSCAPDAVAVIHMNMAPVAPQPRSSYRSTL